MRKVAFGALLNTVQISKSDHFFTPFRSPLTDLIDFGMAGKLLTSATRGEFDLSPKAEPERPGRAFDFAVLPVLSDREPLEQCSNGSSSSRSVGADRTGADI